MSKLNAHEGGPVTWSVDGDAGIIRIDAANGGALSPDVACLLAKGLRELDGESTIGSIIVAGVPGRFLTGNDIDASDGDVDAAAIVAQIETITKPVIAAITGPAIDVGLEIALACDLRIATPSATAGLPGLTLGVPPRHGATQRLPRLVGIAKAIDLIAAPKPLSAEAALAVGIFDRIEPDAVQVAVSLGGTVLKDRLSNRSVPAGDASGEKHSVDAAVKRAKGIGAIERSVSLIADTASMTFEEGLSREQANYKDLRYAPEAKALRYLKHAEAWARTEPGMQRVDPRKVERTAVVGAGTMGSGIAYSLLAAGLPVVVLEQSADAAIAGRNRITEILLAQQKSGRLSDTKSAEMVQHLTVTENWDAVRDADLVIEAAFEDIGVKAAIFDKLDKLVKQGAVLATNTSYLDVDEIAQMSGRPADMVGLHFFSPAHVMRLLEVVQGDKTAPDVLATALSLGCRIGKLPIVARVCDGFIGNRIFAIYRRHAEYLLEDGASPAEIDSALRAYGFAMGPFAVSDMSGLDIAFAMRKRRAAARDPNERYVGIPDILCKDGRLGRKTGAGWYDYVDGKPVASEMVERVISAERQRLNVTPQAFSPEQIQRRILAVMANEGAKVLEEGISARASDIDLVFVHGYGFPRLKGGPMFAADHIGLPRILAEVKEAARVGGVGSEPSALLVQLARQGSTFAAWQRESNHER
ncbi:FAD-dependent oxidoreductase [Neorhizobium sp. JUb45]|uniref:FAD-dependent oxidoreductase n=1 Tax=Neorhizobium sp. JUb45 TaxID=2485113 RepID=UPI001050F0E8|nr:FAD-dependent oxidoreductase [Neorhizobium sp. JUb45]TCQ97313.1 3-hydroxyacyl-CoA dehydrogenase [Neorhizobium sp. JUb45]